MTEARRTRAGPLHIPTDSRMGTGSRIPPRRPIGLAKATFLSEKAGLNFKSGRLFRMLTLPSDKHQK
ncbi:MAG: hypothetical protein HDS15_05275 [Bacteroides sp.]|nr:hypothetical protein [Bacteroides sp.]